MCCVLHSLPLSLPPICRCLQLFILPCAVSYIPSLSLCRLSAAALITAVCFRRSTNLVFPRVFMPFPSDLLAPQLLAPLWALAW
eukprot:766428-Hanusia_phi.AAC.9